MSTLLTPPAHSPTNHSCCTHHPSDHGDGHLGDVAAVCDDDSPVLSGWAGPSWSVPVQMAINALDWGTITLPVVRSVLTAEISLMAGRGHHSETRETVATLAGVCYGTVGRVRALAVEHGVLEIDHRGNHGHHTRPKRVRLGPVITNATSPPPPAATNPDPNTPTHNPPSAATAPIQAPDAEPAPRADEHAASVEVPNADLTAVAPTSATAVAPTSATPNTRDNYLASGSSCETKGCTNPVHLNPRGEPNRLCKPCYWHRRAHPSDTQSFSTSPIAAVAPCFDPPEPVEVTETEYRDLLDALNESGTDLDALRALNRALPRPGASQRRTPQWAHIRQRLDRS